MSFVQPEAEHKIKLEEWARKYSVSADRMHSLAHAFGADEKTIAEVLRLSGGYSDAVNALPLLKARKAER